MPGFAYRVYGLALHSELAIPELLAEDSAHPDIVLRCGPAQPAWLSPENTGPVDDPHRVWAERDAALNETACGFGHVGRFWIRAGHEIVIDPHPGVEEALLRHAVLGPILAQLLWQRDLFTLHASVLGIEGHHVAFVGVSGEGKSTTAAALEAQGHTLVCDDVAALDESHAAPRVLPGFPRMRLYADSMRGVGDEPERHPPVHSLIDKRSKQVRKFAREPVVLERLFVLASGEDFAVTPLSRQQAMMELLRHTFNAQQYGPLYGPKHHLERAARLAAKLPVLQLTRPRDLARLPELVRFVEAHAAG